MKLFLADQSVHIHYNASYERYYKQWSDLNLPAFDNTRPHDFLPQHLTKEERRVAMEEHRALPEVFYTETGLPVITPDNCSVFMSKVLLPATGILLWTWFSGTSRLSYVAMHLPFVACVLFPVDLRYGWDLRQPEVMRLLQKIDEAFRPLVTTFEMRCKYWSVAGWKRDPAKTAQYRDNEEPMLSFLVQHAIHLVRVLRHCLFEHPWRSASWTKSPLRALRDVPEIEANHRVTCLCPFSEAPDGDRHEKKTRLKSSFQLVHSVKLCQCRNGHIRLWGYDPDDHELRTAKAAG